MIKALIIEDELLARLGMRSLVDWESLGILLLRMRPMGGRLWSELRRRSRS